MRRDLNLNTVTLWAMWHPTIIYMQDWNGCSSLEQDNGSNGDRISITLTDKRDGNTYTVAKLKDGKCWMTQNLRLQNFTVTSENTNVNNSFAVPKSDKSVFNVHQCNINLNATYILEPYGAFYTWHTATAGSGLSTVSSGDVKYSICPSGWKLPKSNEFVGLYNLYNTNSSGELLIPPVSIVLSGWLSFNNDGAPGGQNSDSWYWSSSAASTGRAFTARIHATGGATPTSDCNTYGGSIRCIAE